MQSFQNFPTCWFFPLLIGFPTEYLLDLFIHIPNLVLLGAHPEVVARGMGIGVMSPQRVDDWVHHLAHCSPADAVALQLLSSAVGGGDGIEQQFCRLSGDHPLVLPHNFVAEGADGVHSGYLAVDSQEKQERHCNNPLHSIINIPT